MIHSIRLWIWRGLAVFLVLLFFAVRSMTRESMPVRIAPVVRSELVSTVSTNGRIEPEINIEFHSPTNTTVKAVFAQPGDVVPAGKLLMELDDLPARAKLAAAVSGVKSAQATYEATTHAGTQEERQMLASDMTKMQIDRDQAKRDLEALTRLRTTGAASQSEVAAAHDHLSAADASLHGLEQRAQSRYSTAEIERAKAALSEAETNLTAAQRVHEQTSFRAPISGTVYGLYINKTQYAEEGKLLLQMADLKQVRVRAYFDEPEIGNLAIGQKILLHWDARPGREWHGHIIRVPPTIIAFGTRNVGEVLIQIDDPDGLLLPDTNVTVTVSLSKEVNALSIPREALRSENGKPYVFRVVADKLQRTPVTTGTINLTQVAILSGLNEKDEVATGSANGQPLQEGVVIKVQK